MKIPYNKIVLTPEQELLIRDNFLFLSISELEKLTGLKRTYLRHAAYGMGLKKMELEYWMPTQVEFLEFVYRFIGDTEIAEYMQKFWPKNKDWTKKHIEKKRRYLGLKRTKAELALIIKRNTLQGLYAVCNAKRWAKTGKMPIGQVVVYGYKGGKRVPYVKTENGLEHYPPWLWEKYNGPVPEGMVVHLLPGAPEVPEIHHLCLKTRCEMMVMVAQSDTTIAKRFLGAKTDADVEFIKKNLPEVLELKRAQMQVNGIIRSQGKTEQP
jgi:hypothetical protein